MSWLFYSLLYSVLVFLNACSAERNAAEEAICAPFLTSRNTSPLIGTLERDFKVDEDGEFACELVLQDKDLPAQIRLTIHEGLSWLAIRHVGLGLPKHRTVVKHLRLMSILSPKTFDFALRAGMWSMEPEIAEPEEAVKHFYNALYGAAADDTEKRTPQADYRARKGYAQALGLLGNVSEMHSELSILLAQHPLDFDSEVLRAAALNVAAASSTTGSVGGDLSPISVTEMLRSAIRDAFVDAYDGFVPENTAGVCSNIGSSSTADDCIVSGIGTKGSWRPQHFSDLPDKDTFNDFVRRREPFVVSLGSLQRLVEALHWPNVPEWFANDKEYMIDAVGEEEPVMIERSAATNSSGVAVAAQQTDCGSADCGANFGFGFSSHRKFALFSDVVKNHFRDAGGASLYLNIQKSDSGDDKFRAPLHKLSDDVPAPLHMIGDIWDNVTDVNLWMGEVSEGGSARSRLHMDATDNLYVVLEGNKKFSILSPKHARELETVSPSFAVSSTGLSYQFNVLKFKAWLHHRVDKGEREGNATAGNSLLNSLLTQEFLTVDYDRSNFHFVARAGMKYQQHISTVELSPGDLLYLPTGWFHQVVSSGGAHTSLNYWWKALDWKNAVHFEQEASEIVFANVYEQLRR